MEKIEKLAHSLGITENQYSYDTNSEGEVVSLSVFEPEYYLQGFTKTYPLQFASSFKYLEMLEIDLDDFVIEDLNEISELKFLKELRIDTNTKINNLDFSAQMDKLENLYIQTSDIENLNGIEKLQKLTHLYLGSSKVQDLSPLEMTTNLLVLGINYSNIKDISVVTNLKKLTTLNLNHNIIEDISVLSEFTDLEYLDLSFNKIKSITPIEKNIHIKSLNISNNEISDVKCLENFSQLIDLSVANNKIDDISSLENIKLLQNVNISGNKITSITPFQYHKNIKIFQAAHNQLDDIQQIHFSSQFTYLNLEHCGITDVSFLRNQNEITYLLLNNNSIKHLSALENLMFLKEIHLRDNLVENFPTQYFSNLEMVDLTGNRFGNAKFHRYENSSDTEGRKYISMNTLKKLNADYYFNKGKMDEALAYFYYDDGFRLHPEIFCIYLQKLIDIPVSETVYIKYYFSKISEFLLRVQEKEWLSQTNYQKIHDKISLVKEPERSLMIDVLEKIKTGKRSFFNFNFYDFHFYEEKVNNPLLDDEILFIKGSMRVDRENLMTNLYCLKLLRERNSPFYFNLSHKINKVLEMNFAATEDERKEYHYYKNLLRNPDSNDIKIKKLDFSNSYFDKNYPYTHYRHPKPENKKDSKENSNLVLILVAVVTIFAFFMAVRSCLNLF